MSVSVLIRISSHTVLRLLYPLTICAASGVSQPFSFGVKAGVPLTENFSSVQVGSALTFEGTTNRYIIGPEVQVNLPFGFALEVDGLYRHFHYATSGTFGGSLPGVYFASAQGGRWEVPLLGKYRFRWPVVRPYLEAGVAWDRLAGFSETITQARPPGSTSTFTTSTSNELNKLTVAGFVAGGGLDLHALYLHITPEVRYTHWSSTHFQAFACFINCFIAPQISNQDQAELLVGITF